MCMTVKGHLGHSLYLFVSFEVPVMFQKHFQMLKNIDIYCKLYNIGNGIP